MLTPKTLGWPMEVTIVAMGAVGEEVAGKFFSPLKISKFSPLSVDLSEIKFVFTFKLKVWRRRWWWRQTRRGRWLQ